MYPAPIERYLVPHTLEEALESCAQFSASIGVLAGGQSLVPALKARVRSPSTILDINRITGLNVVALEKDTMSLGALVRYRTLLTSPLVQQNAEALVDAASVVGDLQVRNRGTVIGNICQGDPTADMVPPALVLGALLQVASKNTQRLVPLSAFYLKPLAADELAIGLTIPLITRRVSAFAKFGRVTQDRAIINVAASVVYAAAKRCDFASIVVGGVLPRPQYAFQAAASMVGSALNDEDLNHAADLAVTEVLAQSDAMASAEYRSQLIRELTRQVLATCRTRGQSL